MSVKKFMAEALALYAMAASGLKDEDIFMTKRKQANVSFSPNYRSVVDNRELREFVIKGQKVMAYSKKDALQRLKHKKK